MLIERYNTDGRWKWRVVEVEPEPSCRRFIANHWDFLVIGSYQPGMPVWLKQGVEDGKTPADILSIVWEKYDGHCIIIFLNNNGDQAIIGVDPYAIAKAYLYSDNGRWLIGTRLSEVLQATSDNPPVIHPQACAYFLLKGYTPARHTFYMNITKIPPGSILMVESGKSSLTSYLSNWGKATVPANKYLSQVRETWENSLRSYLNGFKTHYVALSGGIDSTTLLASLLYLDMDRERFVAKTCKAIGGDDDNIVLNPYDCEFARRVANEYAVRHEFVSYHWSDERVLDDFQRTVRELGTEDGIGSLMFQSLAPSLYSDDTALYAAQNADSIFSFASTGWPVLKLKPPFITGLGGWVTRHNLFGGPERKTSLEGFIVKFLLSLYLRRHYHVRMQDRTVLDRMFGMTFNSLKWPVRLNEQSCPYIADLAGLATWFEQEYIVQPDLMDFFEQNPHGAFVWLFLHNYMQGTANRGTAWPTSVGRLPSFLPFASLGILRDTMELIPDFRFHWFGKYPILWMAHNRYNIPDYVINRQDPATPGLDRMFFSSFFSNSTVYEYLNSFFPQKAKERFCDILEGENLDRIIMQFKNKRFNEANLQLMLRMCWLLTLEQLVWQ